MRKPFRIGIIGCGKIAPRHLRACLLSPKTELAALVDPVVSRARQMARRFGVDPFVCSTVADALRRVDGVVVAVPNHLHRKVAVECLTADIPVLIEKPLAASVEDGATVRDLAGERGVVAAVAYMTRFWDNIQLMGELLTRRQFGEIQRFAYQAGSRGSWSPLSGYNLDRSAAGGGVLVVSGTHFLDRVLAWFGYPDEVGLVDDALGGPEANAVARFHFPEHDVEGTARFSKTLSLPRGLVMETDAGTVRLAETPDAEIVLRPRGLGMAEVAYRPRAAARARPEPFTRQLEDFVEAVQEGRSPMVSASDGLRSLELIEALYARRTAMEAAWYPSREPQEVSS